MYTRKYLVTIIEGGDGGNGKVRKRHRPVSFLDSTDTWRHTGFVSDLPSTPTRVVANDQISNYYGAETDRQFRELLLSQGRGVGETRDG